MKHGKFCTIGFLALLHWLYLHAPAPLLLPLLPSNTSPYSSNPVEDTTLYPTVPRLSIHTASSHVAPLLPYLKVFIEPLVINSECHPPHFPLLLPSSPLPKITPPPLTLNLSPTLSSYCPLLLLCPIPYKILPRHYSNNMFAPAPRELHRDNPTPCCSYITNFIIQPLPRLCLRPSITQP
jgi:hypothetical protein